MFYFKHKVDVAYIHRFEVLGIRFHYRSFFIPIILRGIRPLSKHTAKRVTMLVLDHHKTTKKLKIPLANNGSQNSTAVSEMAVLLMMAVNRKLPHFHERTITGNWKNNSHGFDLYEMHGKTLGIIGFGNIGKKVAKICTSFGMKILYFDKIRASKKIEKELNAKFTTKNQIIKKSDILSIHLHLNDETKKL